MEEDNKIAVGNVFLFVWVRHGSVPVRLFGEMVRVIA